MAIMFPEFGPKTNDSRHAEPKLYKLLQSELNDDYTIIHSIPWLSSALVEVYGDNSGIGEVDFLVIHPHQGVLAVEVKGGNNIHRDHHGFYYSQAGSKSHFDPYNQLNRGVFAIQDLLKGSNLHTRLGKAYFFPKSDFQFNLPPEYTDSHNGRKLRLVIDQGDSGQEANRIVELMSYYNHLLGSKPLHNTGVKRIVDCLLPKAHSRACWIARIKDDNRTWLKLTEEQERYTDEAIKRERTLITGWPGSGKTIILVHACRQIAKQGKKSLVVTFNRLLSDKISQELKGTENCKVISFNKLCSEYSGESSFAYHDEATLSKIVNDNRLAEFDVLFVDEGQAISQEVWELFAMSFKDKKIIVMCDDAQAFGYERSVSIDFLKNLLNVQPFLLTESLRMPKAVCEELKLFMTPYYSVINKRDIENDTLNRIVTHDQAEKLKQTIARLISDGISKHDICVLKPGYVSVPDQLVPAGIEVESIGRFRGLEKPIVIIYASEMMEPAEFFCAYSRATSRCIVLLDANYIKNGRYGELGKRLLDSNSEKIYNIAEQGLIKNKLFKLDLERKVVLDSLIRLDWIGCWGLFILYSNTLPLIQELILCHLELSAQEGFLSWSNNSTNHIRLTGQRDLELDSFISQNYSVLISCSTCGLTIPKVGYCVSCDGSKSNERSMARSLEDLKDILSIINRDKLLTNEQRYTLSPYLSASLLVMSNLDEFKRPIVVQTLERAKSYICQAVMIHVFYLIFKNKRTKPLQITNKDVISFFCKCVPNIYDLVSQSSFASFAADAINKLIESNVLKRVDKGKCQVVLALD
ncbi:AAA family ATPase [Vibrio cyclitrophicus]